MNDKVTYTDITDAMVNETWWQKRNLSYTATGYGHKIPTRYMVKLSDSNRWHRVYCMIYGNSGTIYVISKGSELVLSADAEHVLEDTRDDGIN